MLEQAELMGTTKSKQYSGGHVALGIPKLIICYTRAAITVCITRFMIEKAQMGSARAIET
jgi:hypothetical protein